MFRSLDDQLRAEGSDLASLESELEQVTSQHATRVGAYRIFSGHLARMGMDAPEDRDAFTALQDRLPAILDEAAQQQQELQPRRREAARQAGEAIARHRERAAELAAVQASGSLLPARAIERRDVIARGARRPGRGPGLRRRAHRSGRRRGTVAARRRKGAPQLRPAAAGTRPAQETRCGRSSTSTTWAASSTTASSPPSRRTSPGRPPARSPQNSRSTSPIPAGSGSAPRSPASSSTCAWRPPATWNPIRWR